MQAPLTIQLDNADMLTIMTCHILQGLTRRAVVYVAWRTRPAERPLYKEPKPSLAMMSLATPSCRGTGSRFTDLPQ